MPALILGELAMKQERALEEKAGTQLEEALDVAEQGGHRSTAGLFERAPAVCPALD